MKPTETQLAAWGASLREIERGNLAPDEDGGEVRWFLGDAGAELFVWSNPGRPPHHVQLVFGRTSVEWSEKAGLATGDFRGGSATAGGRYDPYLLTVARSVDDEVCRAARQLLLGSPPAGARAAAGPLLAALEAHLTKAG